LEVAVASELAGRARLGLLVLEGLTVRDADAALATEIEAYGREVRERYAPSADFEAAWAAVRPLLEDARSLYKAVGLDPTKTRPSNEALLRRLLKGEALYRVNTLVDALNLCSLRFQLPFGLYDLEQVAPPVVLRRGTAGESYEGIRKGEVHVEGRPVLADARGAFGNPTSDSARTMVTTRTRRALVTVYAPAAYAPGRLDKVLDGTAATLTRVCGGTAAGRDALPRG
jgi:DNA/RNA-binding domain of Phe-tRNA-synthetase-like protein